MGPFELPIPLNCLEKTGSTGSSVKAIKNSALLRTVSRLHHTVLLKTSKFVRGLYSSTLLFNGEAFKKVKSKHGHARKVMGICRSQFGAIIIINNNENR